MMKSQKFQISKFPYRKGTPCTEKGKRQLRNNDKARTMTAKLLDFIDKEDILRRSHKSNGAEQSLKEDFSRETIKVRKMIWD